MQGYKSRVAAFNDVLSRIDEVGRAKLVVQSQRRFWLEAKQPNSGFELELDLRKFLLCEQCLVLLGPVRKVGEHGVRGQQRSCVLTNPCRLHLQWAICPSVEELIVAFLCFTKHAECLDADGEAVCKLELQPTNRPSLVLLAQDKVIEALCGVEIGIVFRLDCDDALEEPRDIKRSARSLHGEKFNRDVQLGQILRLLFRLYHQSSVPSARVVVVAEHVDHLVVLTAYTFLKEVGTRPECVLKAQFAVQWFPHVKSKGASCGRNFKKFLDAWCIRCIKLAPHVSFRKLRSILLLASAIEHDPNEIVFSRNDFVSKVFRRSTGCKLEHGYPGLVFHFVHCRLVVNQKNDSVSGEQGSLSIIATTTSITSPKEDVVITVVSRRRPGHL
mmetsp:Transcript_2070/g.5700  ORF Transcript_2070/g.5700 Transcript_2070/m.5700 type:complete len:386 (-) Transcript_2070:9-1166(-)